MPRKPDTPEERALKLAQSYTKEMGLFERAEESQHGIFVLFGSEGEAINKVQKLNRCRVLLRKDAVRIKGLESFEDIVVRREGTRVILQKARPLEVGNLSPAQSQALEERRSPLWKEPETIAPVPLTDDEALEKIKFVESIFSPLLQKQAEEALLPSFHNDEMEMLMTLERLIALGRVRRGENGELSTKG